MPLLHFKQMFLDVLAAQGFDGPRHERAEVLWRTGCRVVVRTGLFGQGVFSLLGAMFPAG